MRTLSWQDFEQAVERIAADWRPRPCPGIHGIPRGGLCLAVALSHRLELPLLAAPEPGCLLLDDVCESGRTLEAHRHLPDVEAVVWISKLPPRWWRAVEISSTQEWILFPWEHPAAAAEDERRYRAGR
jgi:adenine/guanine phosphoribosyltransferase-like PRPP-binding protein